MHRSVALLACFALTFGHLRPAHAQPSPEEVLAVITPIVKQMAEENLRRLRRRIAFGPRLSAAGVYGAAPTSSLDAQIAAGLTLYTFSIPFTFEVSEMIKDRVKERLTAYARTFYDQGRAPTREDLETHARALYREVSDEVLGRNARQDRTLEAPGFGLSLEGGYQPAAGAGLVRLTPTFGVSIVSVGPTIAAHLSSQPTVFVGGELSVRLTPAEGPRPTVYEPFVRFEVPTFKSDRYGWQGTVGLHLLLDLI